MKELKVAFRETPAAMGYRIEQLEAEPVTGDAIAYTASLTKSSPRTWPHQLVVEPAKEERMLVLTNTGDERVTVSVTEFHRIGYWLSYTRHHLGGR